MGAEANFASDDGGTKISLCEVVVCGNLPVLHPSVEAVLIFMEDLLEAANSQMLGRSMNHLIGSYYKMGTVEAAASIIRIINENMANALRVISVYKGVDPHEFTLLVCGGAGPLHAGMMMKRLGLPKCIIPQGPGTHSAFGLITSDIKNNYVRSIVQPTRLLDIHKVHEMY